MTEEAPRMNSEQGIISPDARQGERAPHNTGMASRPNRSPRQRNLSRKTTCQEPTLGLESGIVRVVDHDPAWVSLGTEEKGRIQAALGGAAIDIQHVGSTAVPGLAAKPVIDIAVALRHLDTFRELIPSLEGLEYEYMAEFNIPGEAFFRKKAGTYHLHVLEHDSVYWRNYLFFRNYLQQHPATAQQYLELKQDLAARFSNDRPSYTRGKSDFISSVLCNARGGEGG